MTPANSFVNDFVVSSGQRWVGDFWSLVEAAKATRSLAELASVSNLPIWLTSKADYDIACRANWWMLEEALSLEPQRLTVFALWDGNEDPDGPSGLLERGKALGATPFILDTKEGVRGGMIEAYIRNTPYPVVPSITLLCTAESVIPSTVRVSRGSMMPSSQTRAVAKNA